MTKTNETKQTKNKTKCSKHKQINKNNTKFAKQADLRKR